MTVTWGQPASDGGRSHDLFYRVQLHALLRSEDPVEQNIIIYSKNLHHNANKSYIALLYLLNTVFVFGLHADTSELTHTFRNLKPITQYSVTVVAENGVSYLDWRVEERSEQVEITTAEGRMLLL